MTPSAFTPELIEHAAVGLFAAGSDGRVVSANRAFRTMCGDSLLARVHPDHLAALRDAFGDRHELDGRFQFFSASAEVRWVHVVARWRSGPQAPVLSGAAVDVTSLVADLDAMRAARDEALQVAARRDELLAAVSHEIRSPMSAVVGIAALLAQSDLDARQRDQVATLQSTAEHLVALVNDILDLSRLGTGRLLLERADFDVLGVLDEVGRMFTPAALDKGLKLRIDTDTSLPRRVKGDPLRVRQVLVNLVANAVRFTETGRVTIRATAADAAPTTIRFDVIDTGPGIAPSMHATIFDAFVQGDRATARTHGGSGLGLTICRQLAELMGGRIWVESEPGCGAMFSFTATFDEATPLASTSVDTAGSAISAIAKGRVLLAEDNPVNQTVAASLLHRLGYDVDVVGDGQAALAAWHRDEYALVMLDVQMPELDGYETALRIRTEERTSGRPAGAIVALTGSTSGADHDRALAVGMDDFLTKPVDLHRLTCVLDRLEARRRAGGGHGALDEAVVGQLRALPGASASATLFDDVAAVFSGSAADRVEELTVLLVANRWDRAAREAHAVRGMAADMGAARLANLAGSLEAACLTPEPCSTDAAELLRDLRAELERVSVALAAA